jgi:hypothetical protein
MSDIITIILFVLIWNTPIHHSHPNLIPALAIVYAIFFVNSIMVKILERYFKKNKQ